MCAAANLNTPLLFFSGKGGVGKTTLAAAHALARANLGKRVLLISTDPAHNLGDTFDRELDGTARAVAPGVDALEIDPDAECRSYIARVKENIRATVRSSLLAEAERHIDLAAGSPGAYEAALFDRMVAIILDEAQLGEERGYDQVVFDTAPTGHTIRLLNLPELMGAWIDGLLRQRHEHNRERSQWLGENEPPQDPLYELLHERRRRIAVVRDMLLDHEQSSFVFVLTPEHLPVRETQRAVAELAEHRLPVSALAINKVLPGVAKGAAKEPVGQPGPDDFLGQRRAAQGRHLETIERLFADLPRSFIELQSTDVHSLEALRRVAAQWQQGD
ncbi:arsenical pump-driving ATPase [Halorhodospira halochloris]|uniref:arsenite-transporting ATPase n=1 Tax=Halorhodospira halochloris TaxID=1052 RepID=A0A0X8X7C5_HALHR|nr:ArsA family ATPase [Halorhodospira halochloris]MBK1652267.1 arsenic-transporting ATPase [Halorhodospira halochloris]BAU56939.1 arsenical pump-driving ATPase [Halorhodospira halochloris]